MVRAQCLFRQVPTIIKVELVSVRAVPMKSMTASFLFSCISQVQEHRQPPSKHALLPAALNLPQRHEEDAAESADGTQRHVQSEDPPPTVSVSALSDKRTCGPFVPGIIRLRSQSTTNNGTHSV